MDTTIRSLLIVTKRPIKLVFSGPEDAVAGPLWCDRPGCSRLRYHDLPCWANSEQVTIAPRRSRSPYIVGCLTAHFKSDIISKLRSDLGYLMS